jgi:hypothetical protein
MKIPTNSKIRLVSAGFLGEREVFIGLGTSSEFFNPLDTINGIYDKGITGIKENVSDCLAILGNMSQQVQVLSDSLLGGETEKTLIAYKIKVPAWYPQRRSVLTNGLIKLKTFNSDQWNG